jgi:hypothetical protein
VGGQGGGRKRPQPRRNRRLTCNERPEILFRTLLPSARSALPPGSSRWRNRPKPTALAPRPRPLALMKARTIQRCLALHPISNLPLSASSALSGGAVAAEGQGVVNALDMGGSSCGFDRSLSLPAKITKNRSRRPAACFVVPQGPHGGAPGQSQRRTRRGRGFSPW